MSCEKSAERKTRPISFHMLMMTAISSPLPAVVTPAFACTFRPSFGENAHGFGREPGLNRSGQVRRQGSVSDRRLDG